MTRKPARMFRQQMRGSYTRKEYMGGIPASRLSQFDIGDLRTKFPVAVHLVATEPCLIRDQALEAARISGNRHIAKMAGNEYMFKVRLYPHQVLREHKIAVGAGADRISSGMRAAFGSPVGRAARVGPDRENLRPGECGACEGSDAEERLEAPHALAARN